MDWLIVGLTLLLGFAAGVLWKGQRAAAAAAEAAARAGLELEQTRAALGTAQRELDAARAAFDAWKASIEAQRQSEGERLKTLENAFSSLSRQALKENSETFLVQAGESLEQRRKAIDELLKPFRESLDLLQKGAQELEGKREKAYGSLETQIRQLQQATETLGQSSRSLSTALRGDARARGRWGEVALRNIAEMAGMTVHCDFSVQETLTDKSQPDAERSRPDMIVNLPGGEGRIPVDAKVPMDAYMRALDTEDPDARAAEFAKHAQDLRGHVRTLAVRDYAAILAARVDFTVMFVPSDAVLAAAYESAPDLQTEAMEKRVLLVTPVTLIALLRTVALYWNQAAVAENAQRMWDEAREFHKRVQTFSEHLAAIGRGLDGALKSYNEAVGSYEARVLPKGRQLEELQAPGAAERALPALPAIARRPRSLAAGAESEQPA